MGRWATLRRRLLSGQSDRNIAFDSLLGYLRFLGFDERIRGDHRIFTRADVEEIINLQPLPGGRAKLYQVRQVRGLIVRYGLGSDDD
jgi:hypothetical protein